MKRAGSGRTFAYFHCISAGLNGRGTRPFFWAKLNLDQARALGVELANCAITPEREWFLLTWTRDDIHRLRLLKAVTPNYEREAAANYARGNIFRVTGETSCNIEFSKDGAGVLGARLEGAIQRMRRFVEIRIPNRHNKRNLIEFIPDVALEVAESPEHDKLALAGETIGAELLIAEDFSDWETSCG